MNNLIVQGCGHIHRYRFQDGRTEVGFLSNMCYRCVGGGSGSGSETAIALERLGWVKR